MEEVRSYWQVTSISHFCNIFGKQFKLPTFEPEELEQAFILDIPAAGPNPNQLINHNNNNGNQDDHDESPSPGESVENHQLTNQVNPQPSVQGAPAHAQEQQELHLLVRLAVALLKPHFNCKISQANWELYLRRLIDQYWVDLEQDPSPFRVPLISGDGVELTKNLTFNELPLSDKIDLFYALCDYRLWCEDAADALKDYALEELRLESIGKDSQGYEYWYFSGTRLFREDKELSKDIILRKKRIKELEYKSIELEKSRIFREQEDRRKAELEKARQLAADAREARLAEKQQQQQDKASTKRRKPATPTLPPRTGLRERRSSSTSNNNDSQRTRTATTRGKQTKQQQPEHPRAQKNTRSLTKNSKHNDRGRDTPDSPDVPTKCPEEECREELQRLTIRAEDRAEAWSMQCDSLEEWESFAARFEKTKSSNEKYLHAYINDQLLPNIRAIYAKRAAEVRKKEKELILSLASRRVSTRIISRRAQEEEEERQFQLHEAEMRRKKVEAETRLRAELEREMKARKNRLIVNGGTSSTCSEDGEDCNGRYNLRQQLSNSDDYSNEFEGIIHPDKLSEFYEALELVIDTVRTSKHAWPFVDPVSETVPKYYDLIKQPMDLRKLRTKIEFREYKSLIELEKDFQLLVNNCERFNGPRNVYTKMVYKLWKSFRKNVRLYLQRDLSMDEYSTFVYPPQPLPPPPPPPPLKEECSEKSLEVEPLTMADTEGIKEEILEKPEPEPMITEATIEVQTATSFEPQTKDEGKESMETEQLPVSVAQSINNTLQPLDTEEFEDMEEPKAPTPEPIIIDSYDVACPDDDNLFLWTPQDATPT